MTNVRSEWRDGNLHFLDKDGNTIFYIDGSNRRLVIPSGSDLSVSGAVTAADVALAVINKTGSSIAADKVVAISGLDATSGKPKIVLADADVAAHDDLWVTTAAIANNAEGVVYLSALSAASLNTNSASAAGDPVYLDTTAGGFTHTEPATATARVQPVGFVVVKSATVGQIFWLIGPIRKIGANEIQQALTGAHVANAADDNLVGAIPVLHRLSIADQASGDVDYVLTHKTRVVDVWIVKTAAAGHNTEDTATIKNGSSAITDAIAFGGTDKGITRAAEIDDAQHEIAAGGTLKVTLVKGGGGGNNTACEIYVLGLRVA